MAKSQTVKQKAADKTASQLGANPSDIQRKSPASAPADIDPSAPTTISVADVVKEDQEFVLKDEMYPEAIPEIDTINLIDSLDPVRKNLADKVKVKLLAVKYKRGQGEQAQAMLKTSKSGKALDDKLVVGALEQKNSVLAKLRQPEITLRKLVEIGAVTFKQAELEKVLTGEEIEPLLTDTKAKAPSFTVEEKDGVTPQPILEVLARLSGLAKTKAEQFVVPVKEKKNGKK